MNKLHIMTILCIFLLFGSISGTYANDVFKKGEPLMAHYGDDSYWGYDTICVVDGKVFYFGYNEMACKNAVLENKKILVEAPGLDFIPYSDASFSKFYICTPSKCLLVDFADQKSIAQLSTLGTVLPNFERYAINSWDEKVKVAWYGFEVDFPNDAVTDAEAIRTWLAGKIAESNGNQENVPFPNSVYIDYRKRSDGIYEYTGDLKDKKAIAQFAADFYFADIDAEYGMVDDENFLPASLSRDLNMQAKVCNDRFVTYQEHTYEYSGGAHGYYTERLISYDHVHHQEIDMDYLFKPSRIGLLVCLLAEEAQKSPKYKECKPNVRDAVTKRDENGNLIGYGFPTPGLSEEGVVFSFQPYEIGSFSEGTFHFVIPYERLKHHLTERAKWCLGIK